jgi:hypothetical protein
MSAKICFDYSFSRPIRKEREDEIINDIKKFLDINPRPNEKDIEEFSRNRRFSFEIINHTKVFITPWPNEFNNLSK